MCAVVSADLLNLTISCLSDGKRSAGSKRVDLQSARLLSVARQPADVSPLRAQTRVDAALGEMCSQYKNRCALPASFDVARVAESI